MSYETIESTSPVFNIQNINYDFHPLELVRRITKQIPRSLPYYDNYNVTTDEQDPIVIELMKLHPHNSRLVISNIAYNEEIVEYSAKLQELLYLLLEEQNLDDSNRINIESSLSELTTSLPISKHDNYIYDPVEPTNKKLKNRQFLPVPKPTHLSFPNNYLSKILIDNFDSLIKFSKTYFNLSLASQVTKYTVELIYQLYYWEVVHLIFMNPRMVDFLSLLNFEIINTSFGPIVRPPENYLNDNMLQGLQYPYPYPFYNYSYHSFNKKVEKNKFSKVSITPYLDITLKNQDEPLQRRKRAKKSRKEKFSQEKLKNGDISRTVSNDGTDDDSNNRSTQKPSVSEPPTTTIPKVQPVSHLEKSSFSQPPPTFVPYAGSPTSSSGFSLPPVGGFQPGRVGQSPLPFPSQVQTQMPSQNGPPPQYPSDPSFPYYGQNPSSLPYNPNYPQQQQPQQESYQQNDFIPHRPNQDTIKMSSMTNSATPSPQTERHQQGEGMKPIESSIPHITPIVNYRPSSESILPSFNRLKTNNPSPASRTGQSPTGPTFVIAKTLPYQSPEQPQPQPQSQPQQPQPQPQQSKLNVPPQTQPISNYQTPSTAPTTEPQPAAGSSNTSAPGYYPEPAAATATTTTAAAADEKAKKPKSGVIHQCHLTDPNTLEECLKIFYGKNELLRHQEFVHATKKKIYKCIYCARNGAKIQSYPRHDSLARHIRRKHGITGKENKMAVNYAKENVEIIDPDPFQQQQQQQQQPPQPPQPPQNSPQPQPQIQQPLEQQQQAPPIRYGKPAMVPTYLTKSREQENIPAYPVFTNQAGSPPSSASPLPPIQVQGPLLPNPPNYNHPPPVVSDMSVVNTVPSFSTLQEGNYVNKPVFEDNQQNSSSK